MGEATNEDRQKTHRIPNRTVAMLIAITVLAIAACVVLYIKYHNAQNTAEAQQKRIVAQIGRTVELPQETPAIVTIADKDKLANKDLAARVKNQDMLLIYGPAKRIVIYRPTTKKVVDILSINKRDNVPAATKSISP